MRFSVLISLFAIAQARHLYSEIAPGEFIQPADDLKNLEYHTQQNVNVSYRLNDGFSTSDFGIARDVDGTTEFTTYYQKFKHSNSSTVTWQFAMKDVTPKDSKQEWQFYVNATNKADGISEILKSSKWHLVDGKKVAYNSTTTTQPRSGLSTATGTAITSTAIKTASKTYNSATLTAPPTATTTDSGSSSLAQNFQRSVFTLTSLACAFLVLM
ncbi:hypothetical protein AAP_05980 [Ascosphaera apis ARSEF 7405]|uniref:Uncharacterized protein n=1 Tax=Ascosphaera apis ARSEF 7405 TaxID=392613 RepID=A0A167V4I6_9EURO|nr:hypothetical protein AAP_05980 [Ascosphaera apis ARSEF 7405]